MAYIKKPTGVASPILYVSGPPGESGPPGSAGAAGPKGDSGVLVTVLVTMSADGTLGTLDQAGTNSAAQFRISATTNRSVQGVSSDGTNTHPIKTLTNDSAYNLTISHEDGAALAKDRFTCPGNTSFVLAPGESCVIRRNPSANSNVGRWDALPQVTSTGLLDGLFYSEISSRAIKPSDDGLMFFVIGKTAVKDGFEGTFAAAYGSTATADEATVIAATGGRYIRISPEGEYRPGWFGAVPGGTASTNRTSLAAALNKARGGAKIVGDIRNTWVDIDSMIDVVGDDLGGLHLEDLHVRKTSNALTVTDPGAVLSFRQSPTQIDGITMKNLRVKGNSGTLDLSKAIQLGFAKQIRLDGVRISDFAMEGIYGPGTASCIYWYVSHCHAENGGLNSFTPLSVYNINASFAFLHDSSAVNVGRALEHVGEFACIHDLAVDGTATGATSLMANSTTYPNQISTLHDILVRDSDLAVSNPTDHTRSLGKHISHDMIFNRTRSGISGGNKLATNQANLYHSFIFNDAGGRSGNAAGTAIVNNGGGNVWRDSLFECPVSTTTGTVASFSGGSGTMTVPYDATLAHTITDDNTFTHPDVTGTATVTAVNAAKTVITFTASGATITGVSKTLTYRSRPYGYMVRCPYDDEPLFTGDVVLDIFATNTFFRFPGVKFTIEKQHWNPRGQSYGAMPFIQILDIGGGATTAGSLDCTQLVLTQEFCISHLRKTFFHASARPATFTYKVGDEWYRWPPQQGQSRGERCVQAGTMGTLPATTGTTALGSSTITSITGGSYAGQSLYPGCWITHPNFTAPVQVVSGSGSSCVVSANATASGSGAIAYSPALWESLGEAGAARGFAGVNAQTGAYTAVLSDNGKVIPVTSATGVAVTLPPNSAVPFPAHSDSAAVLTYIQRGAGALTLTPGSGVTIYAPPGKTLVSNGQGAVISVAKISTNEWQAYGDLA